MVNFLSLEFAFGLILTGIAVLPLIFYLYKKYYDLKHDEAKSVLLLDFKNHLMNAGKFEDYDFSKIMRDKYVIYIKSPRGVVEDWTILLESQHNFTSISREYKDYLLIYCNFEESDFEGRVIKPLFDVDVIKYGLENSIDAFISKSNPMIKQIEYYKKEMIVKDRIILEMQMKNDSDRLKFILAGGLANTRLLDGYQNEFLTAPMILERQRQNLRRKYLNTGQKEVEELLKKINEEAEEKLSKFRSEVNTGKEPVKDESG